MEWKGLLRTYKKYLPINEKTPMITMLEGNTPLVRSVMIAQDLDLDLDLYFKYEGLNPTGSFKDRGMVMAVAKAMEAGSKTIMCASTGNTSASAAAYAARCGLKCIVLVPSGNIAMGKLAQALIYGAEVIAVDGNFDNALEIVRKITSSHPITLVNSVNPFRIEGQKTGAYEISDRFGNAPDYLAIPVGNAGNITAYWAGFKDYHRDGKNENLPKMLGFQAEGASPIVAGHIFENPQTIATAIKIGNPASWKKAETALNESKGHIDSVTDDEILEAYKMLASREGVFAEPASCASLAGVLKLHKKGFFKKGDRVVCVLTGNGLKDPSIALSQIEEPHKIPATEDAVLSKIYG